MWDIYSVLQEYAGFDYNNISDKSCTIHVNNTKYKFHEHEKPLFLPLGPALIISGHQSGINSLDFVRTSRGMLFIDGMIANHKHVQQEKFRKKLLQEQPKCVFPDASLR